MEQHPMAGQTVQIRAGRLFTEPFYEGDFRLEDWWINISPGKSWMDCNGNPACLNYAIRSGLLGLPFDNQVVYGKIDGLGYLIHVTEIAD